VKAPTRRGRRTAAAAARYQEDSSGHPSPAPQAPARRRDDRSSTQDQPSRPEHDKPPLLLA